MLVFLATIACQKVKGSTLVRLEPKKLQPHLVDSLHSHQGVLAYHLPTSLYSYL